MSTRRVKVSTQKIPRFSQTQILYAFLLVAVFLVGYLLATVQAQKGSDSGSASQGLGGGSAGAGVPEQGGQPPAPDAKGVLEKLTKAHLPIKGDENAKVAIVEFSDFECPFCARFFQDTLPKLTSEYIDTGKVKLDYRHFPLAFHPQAKPLAVAAECANEQGKFWEMHDKIFTENASGAITSANAETYKQWALDLGLSAFQFNSCYDGNKYSDVIEKDTALGTSVGVSGTPTFYINGRQLVGAQPFESFKTIIDEELKK